MDANEAWLMALESVLTMGKAVPSSGRVIFEVMPYIMQFDMYYPIVTLMPDTSWRDMVVKPVAALSDKEGPFFKQRPDVVALLDKERNARMDFGKGPGAFSVQFMVRRNRMHFLASLGEGNLGVDLPYRMLTFACMAAEIASSLQDPAELGPCYIHMGSCYIYEDDMDRLSSIHAHDLGLPAHRYKPWQVWQWPAIKEALKDMGSDSPELTRERLLGVSG